MRNLSEEFVEQQNKGNHDYQKFVDITLKDGTVLHLTNKDLWSNGFSFYDSVSSQDNFDIGSAIVNKFKIVINNIYDEFSNYVFAGSTAVVYVGLRLSNGVEKIRICTGVLSDEPKQRSSIITLQFLDNMSKFDKDYSEVKTLFPATRNQIVRDICSYCGVTLQTVTFDNDDYIIQKRPVDEALTCRQMLAWVAQIGCQWVKCDEYGRLCISWYKDILFGEMEVDSNGALRVYEQVFGSVRTEVNIDKNQYDSAYTEKGVFDIEDGSLVYLAGEKSNRPINVRKMTDFSVDLEDVVITGVKVTEYKENSTQENPAKTYLYGSEGYVLNISANKLITEGTGQTISSMIGEKCVGMRFRPFQASCLTDVSIEAGDPVIITDRKGNVFNSFITNVSLRPGDFQSLSCGAKSAERNSAKQYSIITQVEVEARQNVEREKTEREKALQNLSDRISQSSGSFTTVQEDEKGGKIFYLHNKPNLKDSNFVWKMTAEAWAVSTDCGETWNGGMTVDGDTIVRILTATGVNADWIDTGAITVRDEKGNIIFSVDMDTKRVIISGDSVQIGGRPVQDVINSGITESKNYSDKKLSDYANTVTKDLENLQAQVDGQVEDYYYDYEPSMQNVPASQWTTTEERQKHIGDRFFWKSKGYAYRFMENNGTWGWTLLQDTDITKAMQTAQNAKDVADGKRRTFITQPVPPYDIGDMWTNGEDILTCSVSRASGTSYVSSDWEKLNNYTDDTVANQALEEARKAHNLTMSLGNEYQGIPADYNGNIISPFPTVKTGVTVYYGHSDISENCSYSVQKSASVAGSWDNTNREYKVTNLSSDTGWVDITATYLGKLTVTKRFNVSKNKGGVPGTNGGNGRNNATVYLYQRKASVPSRPTNALTYTFATGVLSGTINNGWSATIPNGTAPLYVIVATASSSAASYSIPASAWTSPVVLTQNGENGKPGATGPAGKPGADGADGTDGKNGLNVTTVYLYQRKTSVPPKPTVAITYTFATGAVSGLTNGWSKTIPAGTAPLYVILATASSTGTTDSIAASEWSTPTIMTENGVDGAPGAPGRTYFIEPSTLVLKKGQDNVISPGTVDFKAYYRDGSSASRTAYSGRFKIEETVDGTTWKTIYTSSANESSVRHSTYDYLTDAAGNAIITASGHGIVAAVRDIHMIRCTLYAAGGTTNALDTQSVTVVKDVDNLKPEEVFDLLTENGKIQGFYKENGQIYINSTYIKSGTFVAGGANNQNGKIEVRDSSNQVIGRWDKDGIYVGAGTIISKNKIYRSEIEMAGGRLKFLSTGTNVGYIGANEDGASPVNKGLVFDMEYGGNYMTWAIKATPDDTGYTPILYYARKEGVFYAGGESINSVVNLDLHHNELENAHIRDFSVRGSFKIPNNVACDVFSDINFHNWRIKNVKIENIDSINGIKPYSGTKAFGTGMYITIQNGIITNIA